MTRLGMHCMRRDHYCVCRSCETRAIRRPAARSFVQDAQSAMRLPESQSRLTFRQSHGEVMAIALLAA